VRHDERPQSSGAREPIAKQQGHGCNAQHAERTLIEMVEHPDTGTDVDGRFRSTGRGTSVLICAASDIHGARERLNDDVLASEAALSVRFDWMLHVGGFLPTKVAE
jgi:hypothetical protein